MMKRTVMFGVLVGALLGAAVPSWAVDLKWGGDYRLRGFYIDNLTDADKNTQDSAAYYSSRFLLTLAATEDNVSGVVTLAAGTDGTNGNRLLGATSFGPDASGVGLVEAYIKADFTTWGIKGGRAIYKLGNGILLDDAVDGVWLNFGLGGMALTVATLKLVEVTDATVVGIGNGGAGTGTGDDADLYVLNLGGLGGMMPSGINLNLFATYLTDRDSTLLVGLPGDTTVTTIGAAADAPMGPVRFKGELDFLTGEFDDGSGTTVDLSGLNLVVGVKIDAGMVPIGVDLIYTSGQDPSAANEVNINGLSGNYPVGIIIANTGARSLNYRDGTCLSVGGFPTYPGGSESCIGGLGLTAIKLSTGLKLGPPTLDVAAIYARATEEPVPGADTDIGIELDAMLTWALTKRLSASGGIGYLMSGDIYGPNADEQTVLVTQLAYTF